MLKAEGRLKLEVDAYLKSIDAFFWKPVVTAYSARAVDYVGCYKGRFFCIETKAGKNKATPMQQDFIRRVEASGGWACVAYDVETVRAMIADIEES